jgi:hypothetical protein
MEEMLRAEIPESVKGQDTFGLYPDSVQLEPLAHSLVTWKLGGAMIAE